MKNKLITGETKIFLYNVAWLRRKHGLSKKDMAKILGISTATRNKIEKGEMPPRMSVEIVFNIYEYFGVLPKNQFVMPTD